MMDTIQERVESIEHWELLTLMVLTCTAIVSLYTVGLLFVRPLFATVDFHVFLTIGIGVAGVLAGVQYWFSMRELRQQGETLSPQDAPALHDAAQRFADEMGIEKPELRIIDEETPNAFAIGRRTDGIVFFHTGLLEVMSEAEVEAILAHELAHLQKRDVPVMQLAAAVRRLMRRGAWVVATAFVTILGMIAAAADENETAQQARTRQRRQATIIAGITAFVSGLVLLFSRALSRYREYVADLTAARVLDDPQQMASALRTLDEVTAGGTKVANDDTASLYIVNDVQGRLARLFNTHPSMETRIDVIESEFDDRTGEPSALEEGATLGRFTKFGLTGAPAIVLAAGVGTVLFVLAEALIGGVVAAVEGIGALGALVALCLVVAFLASLVAFPWAMLFADGGTPVLGFAAVVLVLLFFFGSAVLPALPVIQHLDLLAYLGLMAVAAVQCNAVVGELRSESPDSG